MTIGRMQVSDFRCVPSAELEFDPALTLISGQNASGKTSLLEAIYLLGRGRSFRSRRLETLIRTGCSRFVVFGEAEGGGRRIPLGVEGSTDGLRGRLAGEPVSSLADLAAVLPVQIIDPEVHRLIEEGPSRRRRFLDWGVFHVEHRFLGQWQQYQKSLKQRNAALRRRQARALVGIWDAELVRLGGLVDDARRRYVDTLVACAQDLVKTLLGLELELQYRSGWNREASLTEALMAAWPHDQESGTTTVGPQRAELVVRLNGATVKDRISRGQQKLLAAALLIAQVRLLPFDAGERPTLLLDDPAAELDGERLFSLIRELTQQPLQLIVTSLSSDFSALGSPGRRYRVRSGVVELD